MDRGSRRAQSRPDNDVAIYAADRSAVLVTHDRRFVDNLLRNGFASVVWLNCPDDEAVDVMTRLVEELRRLLRFRRDDVVVEVRADAVHVRRSQWRGHWIADG
jgi:predicted nuclease of predicted toxin-antitoxin system